MTTTRDEVATSEANTIDPDKDNLYIARIAATCAWHFSEAIRDLETWEEGEYISKLRRYNASFEYLKKSLRVYDVGYKGLGQRLKRQPNFRPLFELVLDMMNTNLHSSMCGTFYSSNYS